MHQVRERDKGVGGGTALDTEYTTWELKECLRCGKKMVEFYSCFLVEDVNDAKEILRTRFSQGNV